MKLYELLAEGEKRLKAAGIAEYAVDAYELLELAGAFNRSYYLLNKQEQVLDELRVKYLDYIDTRAKHIPLQHISHRQCFMGLDFYVDESVLIPRYDTEVLVDRILKLVDSFAREEAAKELEVLDMCTGSGCIGISIAKLSQMKVQVDCADLSEAALGVAKKNAEKIGVEVNFIQSDLFTNIDKKYDIIVSNPPYIRSQVIPTLMEEVREHEPMMALDGSEDGLLFYRKIVAAAVMHQKEGGYLFFEIGHDQGEAVKALMEAAGYINTEIIKDLAGLPRVVWGQAG